VVIRERLQWNKPRVPEERYRLWVKNLVEKKIINKNIRDKEVVEMKLLTSLRASNRDLVIVQYIFPYERVNIYTCIDSETGVVLAEVFVSESKSVS